MNTQTNQTKQTNQKLPSKWNQFCFVFAKEEDSEVLLPLSKSISTRNFTENNFSCVNTHNNKRNLHMYVIWIVQCRTVFVECFKRHVEISHSKKE
jgi:dihydroorotate dehydrogenase